MSEFAREVDEEQKVEEKERQRTAGGGTTEVRGRRSTMTSQNS